MFYNVVAGILAAPFVALLVAGIAYGERDAFCFSACALTAIYIWRITRTR